MFNTSSSSAGSWSCGSEGCWDGELQRLKSWKIMLCPRRMKRVFFRWQKQTRFSLFKWPILWSLNRFLVHVEEGTDPKRVWFSVSRWNDFMTVASVGGGKAGCEWKRLGNILLSTTPQFHTRRISGPVHEGFRLLCRGNKSTFIYLFIYLFTETSPKNRVSEIPPCPLGFQTKETGPVHNWLEMLMYMYRYGVHCICIKSVSKPWFHDTGSRLLLNPDTVNCK